MTGGPEPDGLPPTSSDEELDPRLRDPRLGNPEVLAWIEEHRVELRRSVYGQRLLYQSLGFAFVVGLAAHIVGSLLKSSPTTEPFGLLAELLYALGFSLWTGVVVAVFVQIVPEAKRRQIKPWLDAYEATRKKARAGSDQASGDDGAPTVR
jgi:hypothetical protein